jgi:hypothetical protein
VRTALLRVEWTLRETFQDKSSKLASLRDMAS